MAQNRISAGDVDAGVHRAVGPEGIAKRHGSGSAGRRNFAGFALGPTAVCYTGAVS